jgi:serpin B
VDFKGATEQARTTINKWVEDKTNKKIKDLLKPGILKPVTKLVLTNAIHFKGTWKKQFKKEYTRKVKFHLNEKKDVEVEMMRLTEQKFKYMRGEGFQAVELPYTGEKLSMVVLLPDKVDGLAKLEKECTGENLKKWLSQMRTSKVDILGIPKFKMTCEFSLADTLKEMGMPTAFGMGADFSGMNGKKDLFISAVIHKAFVDVNEEGTEAAATTAVVVEKKSAAVRRTVFYADHPFLFMIRDTRTGAILFMGRLVNPGS